MKTPSTFSILRWINASRAKNNEAEIFARITVNQKRANISLKRKININSWNKSKSRAKGNSQNARLLNQYLDNVKSRLIVIHQDLRNSDKLITAKLMKAIYLGEGENNKSLNDLIVYHTSKIEGTFATGTIRNYEVTEGYIRKFLEQKMKTIDIFFKQLDYRFICDFENFLHCFWPKGHPSTR